MITVMKTGFLDSDKFENTGLEPMTSGSQNCKNYPNLQTGSGLMNYSQNDANFMMLTVRCLHSIFISLS